MNKTQTKDSERGRTNAGVLALIGLMALAVVLAPSASAFDYRFITTTGGDPDPEPEDQCAGDVEANGCWFQDGHGTWHYCLYWVGGHCYVGG